MLKYFLIKHKVKNFYWYFPYANKTFKSTWKLVDSTPGWLGKEEAFMLFALASYCSNFGTIVEIGSYKGRSTIALASGSPEGVVINAIDPHTGTNSDVESGLNVDTYLEFLENTKQFKNIHAIRKLSSNATKDISNKKIQLLFIDGWHSEEAVHNDIKSYLPLCANGSIVVFDDWNRKGVSAGIQKNLNVLPRLLGSVGNILIFSDNLRVNKNFFFKIIKMMTPAEVVKTYSSS